MINKLKTPITSLITANETITKLILLGEGLEQKGKHSRHINYIDYENPSKNSFIITEEFSLTNAKNEQKKSTRIDLVLFVNGIPLVSIELKNSCVWANEAIIVDYRGLLSELDTTLSRYDALSGYDESDLVGAVFKIDGSLDDMWESLAVLDEMFAGLDDEVKKLKILKDLSFRDRFCKILARFSNLVGVVLNTRKLRASLSEDEREKIKESLKKYLSLRRTAMVFYAEDFSLKEYEQSMQKLLDEHLKVGQIYTLNEPLDILSDDFSRVAGDFSDEVKAHGKLKALKNELSKYESKNPELYKRISEMITLVLSDYRANRLDESEFYKRASDVVSEFVSASKDGANVLESNLASDFGDVVANELAKKIKELLAKPEYSHMDKETSKQALNDNKPAKRHRQAK